MSLVILINIIRRLKLLQYHKVEHLLATLIGLIVNFGQELIAI